MPNDEARYPVVSGDQKTRAVVYHAQKTMGDRGFLETAELLGVDEMYHILLYLVSF